MTVERNYKFCKKKLKLSWNAVVTSKFLTPKNAAEIDHA
jgi:hypothetical protein